MYGNDDVRNAICGALRTLTQRSWCGGTWVDPAAMRRQWLRRWEEDDSKRPVFRPTCTSQPIPGEPTFVAARPTPPPPAAGPPRVWSPNPGLAAPNSIMQVLGYDLGLEDRGTVRVRLTQGTVERVAEFSNIGWSENGGGPGRRSYHMDVRMPADLAPGRWLLVVDVKGVASDPTPVEIVPARPFVLSRIVPAHPHPAQLVAVETGHLGQVVDYMQLMDARGTQWRIPVGAYPGSVNFRLPDEVADGEASVRAARKENGVERLSEPLRFSITSAPLPLPGFATSGMPQVAPGQWTDLGRYGETGFEITRADRIEVEFRQGNVAAISRAVGPNKIHVQVPGRMKPGEAEVRTRTWIGNVPSEWSPLVAQYQVLDRDVPPSIAVIVGGPFSKVLWYPGEPDAVVPARVGDALLLRGHFPVRDAAGLRVQLRGARRTLQLTATDVDGGVRVLIPSGAASGDWRIVVAARSGNTTPQEIATVRVAGAGDAPVR